MKKIIFTLAAGGCLLTANGQQQQGRVLYERTIQMQMRMMGIGAGASAEAEPDNLLPHSRKEKLELLFGNGQSLRRAVEEDAPEEIADEGGMHIRMMVVGNNDVSYTSFSNNRVVEQREFAAKNYIITDSIHRLNWKMTGETRTILNYPCQQAVTQRIGKRLMSTVENGQMKSREVADTANITVWFTLAIPVPAGPDFQGQLPGLILAIDINNGATVYQALEVSPVADLAAIREPSKGKKVTEEQFNKEREKLVAEMQRNGRGMMRATRIAQ
ncbi:GLPGLI family protein [Chitinophaga sp. OAE865]|uniref:GLPGLI family protein n=1 Tax=Chitinophaga sp. OAE865 TaxID=2817898 RepID=UPI001AEB943A